jgi:hypothetical protein
MSRGLGWLQRAIADEVRSRGSETFFNELCWHLAIPTGRVTSVGRCGPFEAGTIAPAFYQAFTRAVSALAEKQLRLEKRKFKSIGEFCRLYPYRSPRTEVKALRQHLLPLVERYLDDTGESQFTEGGSEAHYFDQLGPEVLRAPSLRWHQLYQPILTASAHQGDSAPGKLLFALTVKGEELFERTGIKHRKSMSGLLKEYEQHYPPLDVIVALRSLFDEVFPRALRGHTSLKRRLYAIADFSKGRARPGLKTEFQRWLLKEDRSFLEQLPGHVNPPRPTRAGLISFDAMTPETNTVLAPIIADLLGRDALAPAKFLALA